jgi:acyl-CoA thioester hydrolase
MSSIVSLKQRVRYAETDQMGVVYYANYLVWFECGRSHYMRAIGVPYTQLEASGLLFPVTEFQCRLLASAHYDEEIDIATQLRGIRSRQLTYAYEIKRDQILLAQGTTTHLCVNAEHHPVRLPEAILKVLRGQENGASP